MMLKIRPAIADDLEKTKGLLTAAGLPVEDLSSDRLAWVAERNEVFQGAIGIEAFGSIALLRSLVVSVDARGAGIGPALVTALEVASLADGVTEFWLLTIDADAFFTKLGYTVRSRSDAPDAIRATEEFSGLCPDEAVLMSKKLTGNLGH